MPTTKKQAKLKMGGSQSKFKPEPHDVWYKVKATGSQPKFLASVLQAIVDLNESQGSSQGRIIDYIQGVINTNQICPQQRNVAMQVKMALQYACNSGMVRHSAGKYIMALTEKEFAIFQGLRPADPIKQVAPSNKRKRKPQRSRRRSSNSKRNRKYKRYADECLEDDDDYDDDDDDDDDDEDDCFDEIKTRKRRKYDDYNSDSDMSYSDNLSIISIPGTSKDCRKDSYDHLKNKVKKSDESCDKANQGMVSESSGPEIKTSTNNVDQYTEKPSAEKSKNNLESSTNKKV